MISEDQNWTTSVHGHHARVLRHPQLADGARRALHAADVEAGAKVVVLGQTVVDKLFGAERRSGRQMVRIKNIPFQVIGVLAKKGQSADGAGLRRRACFVPFTTFAAKIQGGLKNYINGT